MSYWIRRVKDKDIAVVFNNIIGSLIIRAISLLASMYIVNAYLSYFNSQYYLGIWLTISSIVNWILTFDLGIGNGLRNNLTRAIAIGDYDEAKKYISSAYISLGVLSVIFLIICYGLTYFFNWNSLLNVSPSVLTNEDLLTIMLINFTNVFLRFFFNLITSVLYSLQKTFVINLLSLITNLALLFYLFMSNSINDIQGIIQLSYVYLFLTNIPLLVTSIIIFSTCLKGNQPNIKYFGWEPTKKVVGLGGRFFLAQIELMLITATNEFIINKFYGATYVVDYQIYYKVFSVSTILFSIIVQPIWSGITKAASENKQDRIIYLEKLLYLLAFLGSCACALVALFYQQIVDIWLGKGSFIVSMEQSLIFAFYVSSIMFMNASTCIANGLGNMKTQIYYFLFSIIVKFSTVALLCAPKYIQWETMILITGLLLMGMAILQTIVNIKNIYSIDNKYIINRC